MPQGGGVILTASQELDRKGIREVKGTGGPALSPPAPGPALPTVPHRSEQWPTRGLVGVTTRNTHDPHLSPKVGTQVGGHQSNSSCPTLQGTAQARRGEQREKEGGEKGKGGKYSAWGEGGIHPALPNRKGK